MKIEGYKNNSSETEFYFNLAKNHFANFLERVPDYHLLQSSSLPIKMLQKGYKSLTIVLFYVSTIFIFRLVKISLAAVKYSFFC